MILTLIFILAYVSAYVLMTALGLDGGLWNGGQFIAEHPWIFLSIYTVVISHLTISAMSLSFHRYHTHRGVILHPVIDYSMQVWLWLVTSLNRLDWAAVHLYHHTHSDQVKDPHSPVQKGIWHALFLGVFDYTKAKSSPEVARIRNGMKANSFERFMFRHSFAGPILLSCFLIITFGPIWGAILALMNFLVSPIFAIGGVNAFAHWILAFLCI